MVSVLPYVPSFGEKLASSFGQAAGSVAEGYFKGKEKKSARERISKYEGMLGNINQAVDEATGSPKQFNPLDIAQAYKDYETAYGKDVADLKAKQFIESQQHDRDRAEKLQDEAVKKSEELAKEEKEVEGIRNSIDFLESKIPQVGKTIGSVTGLNKVLDRQQLQDREEFSATGSQLADIAYSRVNKGTQSAEKIRLWKEEWAPNAELSERVNIARINALKRFLNLPEKTSTAQAKKIEAQEKRNIKEAAKTVNVYDPQGNLVGTVDQDQQSQLPPGYTAK